MPTTRTAKNKCDIFSSEKQTLHEYACPDDVLRMKQLAVPEGQPEALLSGLGSDAGPGRTHLRGRVGRKRGVHLETEVQRVG